jgi:hypothetical protein
LFDQLRQIDSIFIAKIVPGLSVAHLRLKHCAPESLLECAVFAANRIQNCDGNFSLIAAVQFVQDSLYGFFHFGVHDFLSTAAAANPQKAKKNATNFALNAAVGCTAKTAAIGIFEFASALRAKRRVKNELNSTPLTEIVGHWVSSFF